MPAAAASVGEEILSVKDLKVHFGELEPIRPEYHDRDARLAVMDAQGIDACWLFPTLAVGMEEALKQLAGCTRLNDALLEGSMELASQARREQARKKGYWDWNAAPKEFTEALSDAVNRALSSTAVPERDRVLWLQFEKAIVGDGPWVPNVQRIAEGAPGRGHIDLRSRRAATFDRGRAVNAADAICIHHRMFPYA